VECKLKSLKLKRDTKLGFGKKMGNQVWFHKSYISKCLSKNDIELFESNIPKDFNYEIIRWDSKKGEIAFIECKDFNSSNEPIVGKVLRMIKTNFGCEVLKIQNQPKDPLIYHHKWMFVKDDYKGFSVSDSKLRSIAWKEVLGVDKTTSSKIGRLSFWNNWLLEKNLEERI
tara:strand:- start:17582 stop:18094 length:513 start_codon:yes stop_codon:yes gene_type:complete